MRCNTDARIGGFPDGSLWRRETEEVHYCPVTASVVAAQQRDVHGFSDVRSEMYVNYSDQEAEIFQGAMQVIVEGL